MPHQKWLGIGSLPWKEFPNFPRRFASPGAVLGAKTDPRWSLPVTVAVEEEPVSHFGATYVWLMTVRVVSPPLPTLTR